MTQPQTKLFDKANNVGFLLHTRLNKLENTSISINMLFSVNIPELFQIVLVKSGVFIMHEMWNFNNYRHISQGHLNYPWNLPACTMSQAYGWNKIKWITLRCRYNAVNFVKKFHKRYPIARQLGQGMGCLFWFKVWFIFCLSRCSDVSIIMADSRFASSQWETSLQSNAVSHWLGANLGSALIIILYCTAFLVTAPHCSWLCLQANVFAQTLIWDTAWGHILWAGNDRHKSHNASNKYPTMHHFLIEMCTHMHISATKWCIVTHGTGVMWDLSSRSISI